MKEASIIKLTEFYKELNNKKTEESLKIKESEEIAKKFESVFTKKRIKNN